VSLIKRHQEYHAYLSVLLPPIKNGLYEVCVFVKERPQKNDREKRERKRESECDRQKEGEREEKEEKESV